MDDIERWDPTSDPYVFTPEPEPASATVPQVDRTALGRTPMPKSLHHSWAPFLGSLAFATVTVGGIIALSVTGDNSPRPDPLPTAVTETKIPSDQQGR